MAIRRGVDVHAVFLAMLKGAGLPTPTPEHRFAPPRRWRFDYAFEAQKVALEVEGGIWVQGRHNRASGYLKDLDKYSEAAAMGWLLIRVTPDQLCTPTTLDRIRRALDARSAPDEPGRLTGRTRATRART